MARHLQALGQPNPRCATRRKSREVGAPDTIRTCGLHLRRVALYPAELRVHLKFRLARLTYEGQRIRPSQTSPTSRSPGDYAPLSAVPPPFSENCLRGAYANISRCFAASAGLLKLLFTQTFLQLLTHETPLTSAFGGQRSIQLSYGCFGTASGNFLADPRRPGNVSAVAIPSPPVRRSAGSVPARSDRPRRSRP